jgi:hypothetical protein
MLSKITIYFGHLFFRLFSHGRYNNYFINPISMYKTRTCDHFKTDIIRFASSVASLPMTNTQHKRQAQQVVPHSHDDSSLYL